MTYEAYGLGGAGMVIEVLTGAERSIRMFDICVRCSSCLISVCPMSARAALWHGGSGVRSGERVSAADMLALWFWRVRAQITSTGRRRRFEM